MIGGVGHLLGRSRLLAACLGMALPLACIGFANAGLVGATYDVTTSVTGNTQMAPLGGPNTITDPATQAFCVGPPLACDQGAGLFGNYAFSDSSATKSVITFSFFGSSSSADGTFQIKFNNFIFADPAKEILGVQWLNGNLSNGDFTNASWDGTSLTFVGSTADFYGALGGVNVAFSVSQTPEPGSLALLGSGVLALVATRRRRSRI